MGYQGKKHRIVFGNPLTAPSIVTNVVITGTTTVGYPITFTSAVVTGNPTPTRSSYQNKIAGINVGSASTQYTPVSADATKAATVSEVWTNSQGSVTSTSAGVTVSASGNPYLYVDAANPTFSTKYGYGNLSNGRVDLRPTQKRILVDGTTSTNGNYYHVASYTAARAIASSGDWILMKGGDTTVLSAALTLSHTGTSHANMGVWGTFDPADPENDAKFNTLKHTIDATGLASGTACVQPSGAIHDLAIVNLKFVTDVSSQPTPFQFLTRNSNYVIFENCTFDGIELQFNDFLIGQISSLTSVGTTATATLTVANTNLATGNTVNITGATPSGFNVTNAPITVIDSTHFTFTIPDLGGATATGTVLFQTLFTRYQDNEVMADCTLRYCGLMYGCGTAGQRSGTFFASGVRRLYLEACVDFHGGWPRGTTRATPGVAGGVGPDIYKHGLYIDDFSDDVRLMECLNAWDSSNSKLTGGNYQMQNCVAVRSPMAFIYAGYGNHSIAWPAGSVFKCDNFLQVSTDDLNSNDSQWRGWGPAIYFPTSGSYFKNGLLFNNDSPNSSNRFGIQCTSNGTGITGAMTIDGTVWGNWNYQNTSTTPDAYTTLTFTNNVWAAATSGSNTTITDKSASYQTNLTSALSKNIHTTFRTAYPAYLGSVSAGATNLDTEAAVFEYMCNNPMPDSTTQLSWAALVQTHFRAALAGA